jgi:HAD superfamily hydrolase (TIGR01458 family)
MRNLKVLLIDLDGTLYFKGKKIPGADHCIEELRSMGFILRFLSNTDSKSISSIQKNLAFMGLTVIEQEIFTPVTALKLFAEQQKGKTFCLLLSKDLLNTIQDSIPISQDAPDYIVVGDIRESVNYDMLDKAFRLIMSGANIIAMQKGRYFMAADGYHVDTGAFVSLLEYASSKNALVLGKPSKEFFEMALYGTGYGPDQSMIVGDDISTDILGAGIIGSRSILVRTGKFNENDLTMSNEKPDLIVDSVTDLPNILRSLGNA